MSINIAIDGPAGAGKSSIAKEAALRLGFIYVDTGALYRAIALYALENKVYENVNDIAMLLNDIKIELKFINKVQHVMLCGKDVSEAIRTPEISNYASKVSAVSEVRSFLFDLQKKIAANNDIIMDGRDIGTVVLPNADLKVFLTASPEERAKRRYLEMQMKPNCPSFEEILIDINKRDYNDIHRDISPLKKADDAVLLDTTDMSKEEVVKKLVNMIEELR